MTKCDYLEYSTMALTLLDLDQDVKYYIINEFLDNEDKVVLYWIVQLRPYIKFIKNSTRNEFANFTNYVAGKGYINLLRWATLLGAPIIDEAFICAAAEGQLQTFQFLLTVSSTNSWSEYMYLQTAVKHNRLNIVELIQVITPHKSYFQTTALPKLIIKYDRVSILEWYCNNIFLKLEDKVSRVKFLHERCLRKGRHNCLLCLLKNISPEYTCPSAMVLIEEKYKHDIEVMKELLIHNTQMIKRVNPLQIRIEH